MLTNGESRTAASANAKYSYATFALYAYGVANTVDSYAVPPSHHNKNSSHAATGMPPVTSHGMIRASRPATCVFSRTCLRVLLNTALII